MMIDGFCHSFFANQPPRCGVAVFSAAQSGDATASSIAKKNTNLPLKFTPPVRRFPAVRSTRKTRGFADDFCYPLQVDCPISFACANFSPPSHW